MKKILEHLQQNWIRYGFESLAILISILAAFALNNWNESRKEKKEAEILYQQLLLDYEANLEQLDQKIHLHKAIINSGLSILEDFDNPEQANLDTLMINLSICRIDPTFDPITNNLVASGKINLIKNPKLNRLLSNWSSDIVALREMQLAWQGIVFDNFFSLLVDLGIQRDVDSNFWNNYAINTTWLLGSEDYPLLSIPKSIKTQDRAHVLNSKKLEGMVSMSILSNQASYAQAESLKIRIQETIDLLTKELPE